MKNTIAQFSITLGPIQLISLKKFLDHVKGVYIDLDYQPFDTRVNSGPSFIPEDEFVCEDKSWKRCLARPNEKDLTKAALIALGLQGHHKRVFYNNPRVLLEDAAIEQAVVWGDPLFAVRISPRKWLLADPEDYKVYQNKSGYALACLAESRTIINEVMKMTENEAIEITKKNQEKYKDELIIIKLPE